MRFRDNIPSNQPLTAHYRRITQPRLLCFMPYFPRTRSKSFTSSTSLDPTSSPGKEGECEGSAKCCESEPDESGVGLSFSASLYTIGTWVDSSVLIFATIDDDVIDEVGTGLIHGAARARVYA